MLTRRHRKMAMVGRNCLASACVDTLDFCLNRYLDLAAPQFPNQRNSVDLCCLTYKLMQQGADEPVTIRKESECYSYFIVIVIGALVFQVNLKNRLDLFFRLGR